MTIENNKTIAEFLGWKREKVVKNGKGRLYDFLCPEHIEVIGESDDSYCSDCGRDTYHKNYLLGEDLLFHKDWSWLMEVVERIEGLGSCQIDISYNWCRIGYKDTQFNYDSRNHYKGITKIEAVYNACIAFIEWYNSAEKK